MTDCISKGGVRALADDGDLYALLQVDPLAEFEVIRAAYRALAAKNHPDVGGSPDRMADLNLAWSILSNADTRTAYDRQRRLRDNGGRWDAYSKRAASGAAPSFGRILEFGRFAGWSIPDVAHHDPDYLEWFVRTPNGRRYQSEIEQALGRTSTLTASASARGRARRRWG